MIVGPLQVIFGDLHGQLFNLFGHLLRVRKQLKAELKAKDTSWFKAGEVGRLQPPFLSRGFVGHDSLTGYGKDGDSATLFH